LVDYLEPESYQLLLRSIERERDRLLTELLYEAGCTTTEAAQLKREDIQTDGTVHFPDRTVPIPPALARALLEQAGSHVFTSRQQDCITPKRIQQILKPHLQKMRLHKTSPHVLRYTHIVHAYHQGRSIAAICKQTGLTTMRLAQIIAELPEATEQYTLRRRGGNQ
jgi:integrase